MENKPVIIMAPNKYIQNGYKFYGFKVFTPYRGSSFFWRAARELWFRMHLPEKIWYSKRPLKIGAGKIMVRDPKITEKYLIWLKSKLPDANIIFTYQNMVGKADHITPQRIPQGISVWTYDGRDARKYGINWKPAGYFEMYCKEEAVEKDYDVVFVGKDKGRAEFLLDLEQQLQKLGLKTKFIIVKDSFFSKNKPFYSKPIPYEELVSLTMRSRAILNVIMENQEGATMRDYESIFFKVKLLTTNTHCHKFEFYHPNNTFVLGEQPIEELIEFLEKPFVPMSQDILDRCSEGKVLQKIFNGDVSDFKIP